ncbi:hypothetical protein FVEG_02053 [Fusarium verticillioides 7600]|uniref:Uncharacterized protein n=1 Tax=Gibberella moniliformis (strain M3125 / FGSC 7600) TaxID=334819 RepID=W7M2B6_GIBM7|nr:hypothetical protein FVEG_02053 [Fusarium verticillioides 7600]EWG39042.1 hypothetical protein FVEG_02053 [Fusarium verticillioides 7600]
MAVKTCTSSAGSDRAARLQSSCVATGSLTSDSQIEKTHLVGVHRPCGFFAQYGLLASKANLVVHHARTRPFWLLSPINVVRPLRVRSSSGLVHAHGSPHLSLVRLERKGTVKDGTDRLSRTTNAGTRRHASILKPRRRQSQPGPPDESTHSWSMLCRVPR